MENSAQNLTLENRRLLKLNGVLDVGSFNESEVKLMLPEGVKLTVVGEKMQIMGFDKRTGECAISGKINALKYSDKSLPTAKRFFK